MVGQPSCYGGGHWLPLLPPTGQAFSTGLIALSYITLTTDFGGSPGVMKGVIWRIAPGVQIADLSHTIRPQDVRQAALVLARQVYYFPENTIHVAVVDPGVGTARRPIAAQIGPQRFVGPDNGIFTPMFQQAEQLRWPVHLSWPRCVRASGGALGRRCAARGLGGCHR
jgi:SAM hydroxide adenosyltransferase N-terminal domain